jgi:tRNA A37 threonylcarbamoyladenosine modification protein TsaB
MEVCFFHRWNGQKNPEDAVKTLSIECSSAHGSIAVTEGDSLCFSLEFENPRGRGVEFFAALEEAASRCDDFQQVLVGTGPGSYNGLRTSIAAAWGLAKARGVGLKGIPSVFGYDAPEYSVIGDARAGQWFLAHVRGGALAAPIELLTPEQSTARLATGLPVFSTSPLLDSACYEAPQARLLARLLDQSGSAEPIYLKPPHITKSAA